MQPTQEPRPEPKQVPTIVETSDIPLASLIIYGKGSMCSNPPFRIVRKGERRVIEFRLETMEPEIIDDYRRNAPIPVRLRDYESCRRHLLAICQNVLKHK